VPESGPGRLAEIAEALKAGSSPPPETVRTLLSWFAAKRRGYWVVQSIREALDAAGLTTEPDFEAAYIDSPIFFRPKPITGTAQITLPPVQISATGTVTAPAESLAAAYADPTYRLTKLAAANRPPVSVKPDTSLAEAVTIMMANDFSQLPVMTTERDVKGAVSWKSVANRLGLGKTGSAAREFMDPAPILPSEASLFSAIPLIAENQYVLVRGPDQRIVGIVTATDLSLQFQLLAEPFLLLGEVENHIRRMLHGRFDVAELTAAKDPGDTSREVNSVSDLTFGEYIRLLEDPSKWQKLGLAADRATFVAQLKRVRDIRNDVMHFDPDALPEEDLRTLRDFARFLQRLQDIGVT